MTAESSLDNVENATSQSTIDPTRNEAAAAKEAAQQAALQAKELAGDALHKVSQLEPLQLGTLAALFVVVATTFLFDMASFSVFSDGAVSETQAAAERSLQARMNSWSYTAPASSITGKLMWVSALAGVGLLVYSALKGRHSAWLPLAHAVASVATALFLALLYVVGFPDLQGSAQNWYPT